MEIVCCDRDDFLRQAKDLNGSTGLEVGAGAQLAEDTGATRPDTSGRAEHEGVSVAPATGHYHLYNIWVYTSRNQEVTFISLYSVSFCTFQAHYCLQPGLVLLTVRFSKVSMMINGVNDMIC